MIDINRLKKVDIFQGLRVSEIDKIVRLCDEVKYDKGAVIFREGQTAEFSYILEKGRVDLRFEFPLKGSSKAMTIMTVPPNRSFGWSGILEPHTFTLSAYCIESCEAIRIHRQEFLDLCERFPQMGFCVMRNLAKIVSERLISHQETIKRELGEYLMTKW